jgi:hypothetical protein
MTTLVCVTGNIILKIIFFSFVVCMCFAALLSIFTRAHFVLLSLRVNK